MLSVREAKKKAEARIGAVSYTGNNKDSYIFAVKGIGEDSDVGGTVWVLNETGKVAVNPFEYLQYKREQRKMLGLPEYDEEELK